MLVACGGSDPVAPTSEPAPEVEVRSDAVMVTIAADVVQMGPRNVPPIEAVSRPRGKAPPQDDAFRTVKSDPWVSKGGRGLIPRLVSVSSFQIDQTEVTRGSYARFLDATGYRLPHVSEPWADDGWNWTSTEVPDEWVNHPVVLVSFYDAQAYCRWARKRLPTEAEWQLAALGSKDSGYQYPWGVRYRDELLNHGRMEAPNFDETDGFLRTAPVGSFPGGRSASGLDDMFGNAWEFTADARIDDWGHARHKGFGARGEMIDAFAPGPGLRVAVRGGPTILTSDPTRAESGRHLCPRVVGRLPDFAVHRTFPEDVHAETNWVKYAL
jgi:formylglycine-generating enzyme required for sulfatase activity